MRYAQDDGAETTNTFLIFNCCGITENVPFSNQKQCRASSDNK